MTPARATTAAALLFLSAITLPACNLRPKALGEANPAPAPVFTPRSMEIHPLTRIEADPEGRQATIDAHIAFLDADADEVKSVGVLRLELYRERGPVEGVGDREQIARWAVNLSDLVTNAEAYDRVTRTYRVTLRGVPASRRTDDSLVLKAWLRLPSGAQLSAERRLGA